MRAVESFLKKFLPPFFDTRSRDTWGANACSYARAFAIAVLLHATAVGMVYGLVLRRGSATPIVLRPRLDLATAAVQEAAAPEKPAGNTGRTAAQIERRIQERIARAGRGIPSGLSCTVNVRVDARGRVLRIWFVRASGDSRFDRYVTGAIRAASPLAPPPGRSILTFRFHT